MQDKCLPTCDVFADVRSYEPSGEALYAEALTAGWPCQVHASVWAVAFVTFLLWLVVGKFSNLDILFEGISNAGGQRGMKDARSGLAKEIFRITDLLPRLPASQAGTATNL